MVNDTTTAAAGVAAGGASKGDARLFDEDGYISELRDRALAQEACIFCTVHCPENRYLIASSNHGRLAVWDLSSYLFPSSTTALGTWNTPETADDAEHGANSLRPVTAEHGLTNFARALKPNEARMYPPLLLKRGCPRLSVQVTTRAINNILFTHNGQTLVLAADDGIYTYPWAQFLDLLNQSPPGSCRSTPFDPPSAHLTAYPTQRAWPFFTESNNVAVDTTNPGVLYSASGDAAVRVWDLERQECHKVMVGHTGYVHSVLSLGNDTLATGTLVSGAEDGKIGLWDVRANASSSLVKMLDTWRGNRAGDIDANGEYSLHTSKWVAALDVDRGGNFLIAGGGVEYNRTAKFGFVSVFHIPSFSLVSSTSTPSFVQDVKFYDEKIISAGNERVVTHWSRPGLEAAARVTTNIPSIFSINARPGPPIADGVTIYAGRADHVVVFINPENCAFNLKFR